MTDSERREFTRSSLRLSARLCFADGSEAEGEADDVSLNGFRCATNARPGIGTECSIVLVFGEDDLPVEISGEGRVARHDDGALGIEISVLEIESHEHLRNLILFHADDHERTVSEFRAHIGLKRWPPAGTNDTGE